jgi:hypothetical protein
LDLRAGRRLLRLNPGRPLRTLLIVTTVEKDSLVLAFRSSASVQRAPDACASGGIAHLAFAVAGAAEAPIGAEGTLLISVYFVSSPMRRVGVRRPVLREAIGLVAVRSFREIVTVAIGMRIGDNKGAVRSCRRFAFGAKRLE